MEEIDFSSLPGWVNHVAKTLDGSVVYLQTMDKGVTGLVAIKGDPFLPLESPGVTSRWHCWETVKGTDRHLASRNPTLGRELSVEEVELLSDLGLLDYALTQAGYTTAEGAEETNLNISVTNEYGDTLYEFVDGVGDENFDRITHVRQFAEVVVNAYKHLGFETPMSITFETGCDPIVVTADE